MPLIRINAQPNGLQLHRHPGQTDLGLQIARRDPEGTGPVIIMIHGFKYCPDHRDACPHVRLFSTDPAQPGSWPRHLGFGLRPSSEGLGIALGWPARGSLRQVQARAIRTGAALAELVRTIRTLWPGRPVHLLTHSLGSEVALEALHHLPARAVARIITLAPASFLSRARAALDTPAGRGAELVNVTSRENDLFDFLSERLLGQLVRPDRTLSHGFAAPNVLTLQLDCADTLDHLARLGQPVAAPHRLVCHWSTYRRPGTMPLYAALLRQPERYPLALLRQGLPDRPAPRWSRLTGRLSPYWRPGPSYSAATP